MSELPEGYGVKFDYDNGTETLMTPDGRKIMTVDADGSIRGHYSLFLTTDSREESTSIAEAMLIYMKGLK